MEDNNTPEAPSPCTAGCGFYGNKIYNNMCSKCFKENDEQSKQDVVEKTIKSETIIENTTDDTTEEVLVQIDTKQDTEKEPIKSIQKNKGRCFNCRSKIPLAKQLTNKCKCEFVFCDTHRFPDKHDCKFDHAKNDKDILAKNNPKLNDKPRGGNSFHRIDSL